MILFPFFLRGRHPRLLAALLCCGLALDAGVAEGRKPTSAREADAPCAKCHQSIYSSYLETPMANASGLAGERLIPGTFFHAASGVEYRIDKEEGSAWLSYRKSSDPGIAGKVRLEYFLGSGHLGLTYLYLQGNYLLESPVAYYPDLRRYDMKPGLQNIRSLPGALLVDSSCLRCHMSAAQRADPGTENRYRGLAFLHSGIACESCHGETSEHVASGGVAKVVNPAKLGAQARDSICIACHLEGTTNVERPGRSALDFKPGENISDYLAYFSDSAERENQRGGLG